MGGINTGRWLGGGVAAGALLWILDGIGSMLYSGQMEAALAAHDLTMEMTPGFWVLTVVVSLLVGLTLVFFYAGVRPRFGPGPKTAVLVAVVMWIGGYFVSLLGYGMMGLFPGDLLMLWGVIALVEMILAALLGGWIYREDVPAASGSPDREAPGPEPRTR